MHSESKKMTRHWFPAVLVLGFLLAFALGFIACGPSAREAPDLVGLSLEDGRTRAESEGFTLEVAEVRYGQESEGTIISQYPEPGTALGESGNINVVVSGGGQGSRVTMPDLVGMTEADARAELERLGISASVNYEYNAAYADGIVARQEPAVGEEARVGSTVALAVAKKGAARHGGAVVCLDPGHANTPYNIDEETGLNTQDWANEPEIQIVFDIALKARDALEARGVRVVMTKQSVYDPADLKQRAVIANEAGATLILHIHTDPGISLPSTFYPGAGELGWKANSDSGRRAYIDPLVQQESERLAKVFHAAMVSFMREKYGTGDGGTIVENRGATGTGNYGPIFSYDVWSRVPTFTIENNQSFADSNRQAIAEGIVEGIMTCLEGL